MFLGKPVKWWLALAILLCGLGVAVLVYAGFLGQWHAAFDTLAHFRMHLAAGVVVAALLLALFRGWRLSAAGLVAAALLPVLLTLGLPELKWSGTANAAPDNAPRYRMLHLNLRFDNPDKSAVLSMIGREKPDIVTLIEVSPQWEPRLEVLGATYPYRLRCHQDSRNGGVAILSRRPFAQGGRQECKDDGSLALATVDFGGQAVDVVALHIGWPWPFWQKWQVDNAAQTLATLGPTAILGGDFNATPWSVMAQRVAASGDLRFTRWVGPTWIDRRAPDILRPYIGLPIDHILVKGAVMEQPPHRLGNVGSDHLPVVMDFTLLPTEEAPAVQQAGLQ